MNEELLENKAGLGDDLTERLASLSPAKRALLTMRLKNKSTVESPLSTIPRVADRHAVPLSFAQQRLWFFDQLEPGSSVYNNASVYDLQGPLNVTALEQSLNEIVTRHEVLRTTFELVGGEPVQAISDDAHVTLSVRDLQNLPETEREAEARRLGYEESRRPFDLARGPLFRASLLRLGSDDHLLVMTIHHIVSDGWSMRIFQQELSTLYADFCNGKSPSLPDLPIQYADFAAWQRNWLQGDVLEKQLSYWKNQLTGVSTLNFPTDWPRPPVQTFHGARESIILPQSLNEALTRLSRAEGATLFMTLLAAFAVLLHRHTGQDDIVVGSPIAGRNRAEIEGLIGFFINTLVLRVDLSGNPTFRELLARVRKTALGAYAHQDLPFEKLVEELRPERDSSRTPLFQVFLNMLGLEGRGLRLGDLTVERMSLSEPESKFDFTLYIRGIQQDIGLELVYNADLFRPDRMRWMLQQFQTLLEGISTNPNQPLSTLRLLTEAERHFLSQRGNVVRVTHPFVEFKKDDIEQTLSTRFEQQVKQFPDHISIRTNEHQWTYSELNRRANQIADSVLNSGGNTEERVGLLLEHDPPMIAAILGILKAGKTYVPLDPSYPAERLAYILEDSQATVLLTDNRNIGLAKTFINGTLRLINIDAIDRAASTENPNLPISAAALAYILYTSGSTGRPKGVMQSHRNVLRHIRNYTNNLLINSDDRMTLLASYSFDAAVMDMFGALLNGATLVPLDLKEEEPGSLLLRMTEAKITIYHSTPTVYRYIFDTLTDKKDLSTIRLVVLGGEEVHKKDVDLFKQHFAGEAIFVNGLGPTESTVALQYFMNHETEIAGSLVPVGYPVEDTEILLLDKVGEETEMYGEIAIRSPHCALGYWQRPELTEAVFLSDPQDRARRIYRTGDMGYLMPDGTIVFAGRRDHQVKIRGFRIELGEIETVLRQHPTVREAAVLAREDAAGDPSTPLRTEKRLVAYIAPAQDPSPSTNELRSFLREKLPEYMVPSVFVILDTLPLTPNGKVDRKALPLPDGDSVEGTEGYVAPRTAMERVIAAAWEEVLGVNHVSVHDNFFDLGGHSLLSVKVIARIEEEIGQRIHPREMVYQTLAQLAAACEERKAAAPEPSASRATSKWLGVFKGMLNRS